MTEPVPTEPAPAASGRRGAGLGAITVATVVAGGSGYAIQALARKLIVADERFLAFTNFWSGLYLLVAALSGLQAEVTRATRPATAPLPEGIARHPDAHSPHSTTPAGGGLGRFALAAGLVASALVGATAPLWAGRVFGAEAVSMVAALVVALVAYAGVAVLSGIFFGLKLWRAVAWLTITDAVARLILVGAALLAGAGPGALAWAIALPFPLAVGLLWLANRGRVAGRYAVDVPPASLARNALNTVGGAVALGVLTSGLPLLIGQAGVGAPTTEVANLVFVNILTRAPLVIPLLALQGWLTVYFRDRVRELPGPAVRVAGGVLGASAVVAGVAYALEPWLLQAIWGAKYLLDGPTCAGIVVTAGLTAALCVTGPAALAAGRHTAYLAGWVAAALTTVAGLFLLPLSLTPRVLAAMALGPVVGIGVHLVALSRTEAS